MFGRSTFSQTHTKGFPFEVADFIGLYNFEWHNQDEVGNIGILVLQRDREKLYCSEAKRLTHM